MMVINEMASALHKNGSTWVHAIRESYRMFDAAGPAASKAELPSSDVRFGEERNDADVPLEAELDRHV